MAALQRNSEKCALIPKPVNSKKTSIAVASAFPAFLEMPFLLAARTWAPQMTRRRQLGDLERRRKKTVAGSIRQTRIPKNRNSDEEIRRIFLQNQLFSMRNFDASSSLAVASSEPHGH